MVHYLLPFRERVLRLRDQEWALKGEKVLLAVYTYAVLQHAARGVLRAPLR
ncbi:MAG: hypothetical protein HC937_00265 [Aquincola sp.]|nr:hypothetical protein [Aquincola sp.]